MTDHELRKQLLSDVPPERPAGYWDDFPAQVRVQTQFRARRVVPPRTSALGGRLAWLRTAALAILLVWVGEKYHPLHAANRFVTRQEHQLRQEWAQLNASLHLLVFNTHGMQYQLKDTD